MQAGGNPLIVFCGEGLGVRICPPGATRGPLWVTTVLVVACWNVK